MSNTTTAVATQQTQSGNSLVPINEIIQAAEIVAKSGLFGVKNKEEAATLMMVAQAEGSHIMTAMREFHVIDGKPSLKADAILARFQKAGGSIEWLERNDKCCKAKFFHPQGGKIEVEWTWEMADKAGFSWSYKKQWNKEANKMVFIYDENKNKIKEYKDNWQKIPRQMLAARVVSEGVRAVCAGCLNGFYTPEEVQDFADKEPLKAEAEVITDAKETPKPEQKQPEIRLNLEGTPPPAQHQAPNLSEYETQAICEFIKSLPDRAKAMNVVKKFCDPKNIRTLSNAQADKLIAELKAEFGVTYDFEWRDF